MGLMCPTRLSRQPVVQPLRQCICWRRCEARLHLVWDDCCVCSPMLTEPTSQRPRGYGSSWRATLARGFSVGAIPSGRSPAPCVTQGGSRRIRRLL